MKKKQLTKKTTILILLSTCLYFPSPAFAVTGEADPYDLDLEQLLAVKVETLNKRPQQFMELPAATYIINRQEIEISGALTVTDLLVRVPGVYVKQLSSNRIAVAIRNDIQLYNTNLLVLIDGDPFYNQMTSNAIWDSLPVAVEDIERIEIVRGDGGTSWGTNSSGGVINIITRSPDSEPVARMSAGAGVNSSLRAHMVTSTGKLRLSAHAEKDSGWKDDISSYKNGYLFARYDTSVGGWNIKLNGRVSDYKTENVKNIATGAFQDGGTFSYDAGLSAAHSFGNDDLFVKLFINESKSDYAATDISDIKHRLADFEARYSHLFLENHRTQVGFNYRHYISEIPLQPYLIQSSERISDSVISGTIDHESRFTHDTILNLGLRYEDFSIFEDSDGYISYSLRLSHQLTKETVFWTSLNRTYQSPSYIMSDINGLSGVSGRNLYYQTGNPNLAPEENRSVEIGMRKLFTKNIFVDVSTYYSKIQDEIYVDNTATKVTELGPVTRFEHPFTNHVESELWGAEFLLSLDYLESLHTDLAFTWFFKKSDVQDDIYRGEINEQYAPKYKISMDSSYKLSDTLNFSLFLLYEPGHNYQLVSIYLPANQTDAHFRADASLHYVFAQNATLSLGVKNLFNSGVEWDYSAVSEVVCVEPAVYLNLKYRW